MAVPLAYEALDAGVVRHRLLNIWRGQSRAVCDRWQQSAPWLIDDWEPTVVCRQESFGRCCHLAEIYHHSFPQMGRKILRTRIQGIAPTRTSRWLLPPNSRYVIESSTCLACSSTYRWTALDSHLARVCSVETLGGTVFTQIETS